MVWFEKGKGTKFVLNVSYEEIVNFYFEHFKGTKAMTRGHGSNRLYCPLPA